MGRKSIGRNYATYDPDYVDPHKDKRGWQPGKCPAIKGPNPFINYGITQDMARALAHKRQRELLAEMPWYGSDASRRIRGGKRAWKIPEYHKWLWEYAIGNSQNRLPKDHPLREVGVTMDPYKVMNSLQKNGSLTVLERGAWEAGMKEMNEYRDAQLAALPDHLQGTATADPFDHTRGSRPRHAH